MTRNNHPAVVWSVYMLWVLSMIAIIWPLVLFYFVDDSLRILRLEVVNGIVLLSGIVSLPMHVLMLCMTSRGRKIEPASKVFFCPLWLCMSWSLIIIVVGIGLCAERIHFCEAYTVDSISNGLKYYRSVPKYKHFMDTMQWALKCCGLDSYKDWFTRNWYDRIRDYEWDSNLNRVDKYANSDSVPLSCCKTGSCIANYLTEMGTSSINERGCSKHTKRVMLITLFLHLLLFVFTIVLQALLFYFMLKKSGKRRERKSSARNKYDIRHILPVNEHFASSATLDSESEDRDESDEDEPISTKGN